MEQLDDKNEIERQLSELPERIGKKAKDVIEKRTAWQTAKALYENEYDKIHITLKAKNPEKTQTDLAAESRMGSHQLRLNMILAEGEYRKMQNELTYLRDVLDSVKEKSYNIRCEIRKFGG